MLWNDALLTWLDKAHDLLCSAQLISILKSRLKAKKRSLLSFHLMSPSSTQHAYIGSVKITNSSSMDEIAVILKRFGDEQSTLLDQFERLTFEVQLNQAILGRSLSEPSVGRSRFQVPLNGEDPPALVTQVRQGRRRRRGSGFNKVLMKLLKPIFRRKDGAKKEVLDPKNPKSWKAFSRSLRVWTFYNRHCIVSIQERLFFFLFLKSFFIFSFTAWIWERRWLQCQIAKTHCYLSISISMLMNTRIIDDAECYYFKTLTLLSFR